MKISVETLCRLAAITCLLLLLQKSQAQTSRYLIILKDKQHNSFSTQRPREFLSDKAVALREAYHIAIDSTDLPVSQAYLDSIRLAGNVEILNTSKWLNQVAIRTTDAAALAKINSFPFVVGSQAIAPFSAGVTSQNDKYAQFRSQVKDVDVQEATTQSKIQVTDVYSYGKSSAQVKLHQGNFLHNHGFRGENMQLAMLDAGYLNYLTHPAFDSARLNNQILGTWDFVQKETSVNEDHFHGMICFSTIAGNIPGTFVGTAPKTSYYLYRTEDVFSENLVEEQNFVAGLEKADSLGVKISSTSLGYNEFDNGMGDHTYAELDGNTTIAARGADFAARKGMLCVIANGNAGEVGWHYLLTPADADSVLAVGAVDTLGNVGAFSSYGPSSDGQVKPGVASVGVQTYTAHPTNNGLANFDGTSLAAPLMAGLATCLWQAFPEVNNMSIIEALQQAGNKYNSPDNRVGYGIPDMKKAFVILQNKLYRQDIKLAGCAASVYLEVKSGEGFNVEIQRKLPSDADFVTIQSYTGSGVFAKKTFLYTDDLSGFSIPQALDYRVRMDIPGDTAFYFTPVTITRSNTCATYTFVGNGNWSNPANWSSNLVPPINLPQGATIVVDPVMGGECIVDVNQQVEAGALLKVVAGKVMRVTGNLQLL